MHGYKHRESKQEASLGARLFGNGLVWAQILSDHAAYTASSSSDIRDWAGEADELDAGEVEDDGPEDKMECIRTSSLLLLSPLGSKVGGVAVDGLSPFSRLSFLFPFPLLLPRSRTTSSPSDATAVDSEAEVEEEEESLRPMLDPEAELERRSSRLIARRALLIKALAFF